MLCVPTPTQMPVVFQNKPHCNSICCHGDCGEDQGGHPDLAPWGITSLKHADMSALMQGYWYYLDHLQQQEAHGPRALLTHNLNSVRIVADM